MDGGRICRLDTATGHGGPVDVPGDVPGDVVAQFIDPPRPSPEFAAAWDKAPAQGIEVELESWQRLQRFAAKILVPESEYSRLHGAGAGFIDQD